MKKLMERNPGMMNVLSFVVVSLVNIVVIYIANMFFPLNVVLGTMSLSSMWALLLSSWMIALITVLAMPFVYEVGHIKKRDLTPIEMLLLYLAINVVGLWLLTRKSEIFGLGVSSFGVVFALAFVLNFVQGIAMMAIDKEARK